MSAADWLHWLPTLIGIVSGPTGAGVVIIAWWKHRERTRAQTDAVAMDLVVQLRDQIVGVETRANERITQVEAAALQERALCDAKLEASDAKLNAVRAQLTSVEGNFDALLLAIEFAPDKAAEVVARIKERRTPSAEGQGERRQDAQRTLSNSRVARDNA